MSHFPTTKTQGNFGFVAFFQKTNQVAQLDLVIPNTGSGTKFNFLNLNLFLFTLGRVLALAFLILKFTEIHDATDRRHGIG